MTSRLAAILLFTTATLGAGAAQAQPAAAADAAKPTPRMADGKPDLNGTWDNGGGIAFIRPQTYEDGSICVAGCAPRPAASAAQAAAAAAPRPPPPGPDRPVYKPEFVAKVKDLEKRQVLEDPVLKCRNPGLPRIGPPDKIVQTAREMVFIYDDVSGGFWRIIPVDGRGHRADAEESYLGDSVGRWEGDTLVIEAVKFNEDSWLVDDGAFHTKDMKVTERLRRNGDVIEYQATVDDPAVLAEPWRMRPRTLQLTDLELLEAPPCVDQDLPHMVDPLAPDAHHDNAR